MVQVKYNGVDITPQIEIHRLDVTEDAGQTPDGIELTVANAENQWSGWSPRRGDTLEICHEGYSSGAMTVDEVEQQSGAVALRAMSIPVEAKTKRTKAWEQVTLLTLAAEKAAAYGLGTQFIGAPAAVYERVDQVEQGDFAFLVERASLEGCSVKVSGGKVVLYADQMMEAQPPIKIITPREMVEEPKFCQSGKALYSGCTVSWRGVTGAYWDTVVTGPTLSIATLPVSSQGEAERFAKNLLRARNKMERYGYFATALDCTITAGNTVTVSGMGLSDGVYYIDNAVHAFADSTSIFTVHQVFGRY